jgi:PTS system nitrogen regulatory IIA component
MHIDLSDLIAPELVLKGVLAANKRGLLQQIGAAAGPVLGFDPAILTEALAAREKLGSTGFGGGVAIPHARIPGLGRIAAMVVRTAKPVEFDALDGAPVDILFILFSPPDAGAAHLKALARVSGQLRDQAFVAKLRGAGSPDAIWALLTADEALDAV